MKTVSVFVASLLCLVAVAAAYNDNSECLDAKFLSYERKMNHEINKQINVELSGHYTYLHLSHIFLEHSNNYPNVAKYFRAKSDEEMQHAERFIQYQNQRGGKFELGSVARYSGGTCASIEDVKGAFECARELEIYVTQKLTDLVKVAGDLTLATTNVPEDAATVKLNPLSRSQSVLVYCSSDSALSLNSFYSSCVERFSSKDIEKVEYIELAEMITHEFLGHQIEDTKEIANHFSTLSNFGDANAKLGSYLFDKNL